MAPSPVQDAAAALRIGGMVVVGEGDRREGSGDLVIAAEHARSDAINRLVREGRGVVSVVLTPARCDELGLRVQRGAAGTGNSRRNFTASIEARDRVTTGISAEDRARTIEVATNSWYGRGSIVAPGHVLPQRAEADVLANPGIAEAALELVSMAGCEREAAVVCGVLREDGQMARVPELERRCRANGTPFLHVDALVEHRIAAGGFIARLATRRIENSAGIRLAVEYRSRRDGGRHAALIVGEGPPAGEIEVRVHRACPAGNPFGLASCSCHARLQRSLDELVDYRSAALVYLHTCLPSTGGAGRECEDVAPLEELEHATARAIISDLERDPVGIHPTPLEQTR